MFKESVRIGSIFWACHSGLGYIKLIRPEKCAMLYILSCARGYRWWTEALGRLMLKCSYLEVLVWAFVIFTPPGFVELIV